jgi:hypothetical protein
MRVERKRRIIAVCLAGVGGSLLLVGVVSATLVRHVIQVAPILGVLGAVVTQRRWAPYAAMPIFAIWLLLMVLIWLYLVGIQTFFTGTFSVAEVVLTVLIGLFAMLGIPACVGSRGIPSIAARTLVVAASGGLQVGAMWASFLGPFANR